MSCGRNTNPIVSVQDRTPGQREPELVMASCAALHRLCLGPIWRKVGMAGYKSAHSSDSLTTPGPAEAVRVQSLRCERFPPSGGVSSQKSPKQAAISKLATRSWPGASLGLDARPGWDGPGRFPLPLGPVRAALLLSRCYTECEHR